VTAVGEPEVLRGNLVFLQGHIEGATVLGRYGLVVDGNRPARVRWLYFSFIAREPLAEARVLASA
jgi:hypothetical protein